MQVEINQNGIDSFKQQLGKQLLNACEYGAMELQDHTPVDTKRLFTTTRAENLRITEKSISCEIVAGGQSINGVIREQGFEKDVDYAIFVENRTGYITQNLNSIGQVIKENL
jgi:hypothetical protein